MSTTTTATKERALALLGQGVDPSMVASAIGVTPSAISQYLSEPEFLQEVARLRYEALSKHNSRDSKYDALEDRLLEKLEDVIPFLIRPLEISRILTQINAAKRRGSSAPSEISSQAQVINLILPTQIIQQFTVNVNNQVIKAGSQDLLTVQSGRMSGLLAAKKGATDVELLPANPKASGASLATSGNPG